MADYQSRNLGGPQDHRPKHPKVEDQNVLVHKNYEETYRGLKVILEEYKREICVGRFSTALGEHLRDAKTSLNLGAASVVEKTWNMRKKNATEASP